MFGHHWEKARGTIVDTRVKTTSGDGLVTIREYIVDVTLADGRLVRALVQEPRIATNFWAPSRGDVVGVEVDSKNDHVRFDKSDPQLHPKTHRAARDGQFTALLAQPPGTGSPVPTQPRSADPGAPHIVRLAADDPNAQAIADWLRRVEGQSPEPTAGP